MKDDNFGNKTTERLLYYFTLIKRITIALICVIVLLVSIIVYRMVTEDDIKTYLPMFVVGVCCSGVLPIQFINMKKIKTELKLRKEQ